MKIKLIVLLLLSLIGISKNILAQEVKINTDFAVETDGSVRLENEATMWDDLRVTIDAGSSAAAFEFFSGTAGPQLYYFRWDAAVEAMSFNVQMPHNWKQGTTIYPHLHWMPRGARGTTTGNVEWNFEYSWANYNSVTPVVFPAIQTITVVSTGPFTAGTHLIQALTDGNAGLTDALKTISSIMICRIWRDGNDGTDTYEEDAGLLFIDIHYEIDSFGSHLPLTK